MMSKEEHFENQKKKLEQHIKDLIEEPIAYFQFQYEFEIESIEIELLDVSTKEIKQKLVNTVKIKLV